MFIILLSLIAYVMAVGEYIPQLDTNGVLLPKQCWGSTGTCWCIYGPNAYKQTRGELICPPSKVVSHHRQKDHHNSFENPSDST